MIGKIQRLKNKKGFTLIELILVIAIIAVLAGILVPLLGDYLTKARISSANASAKSYFTLMNAYMADTAISGNGRNDGAILAYVSITIDSDGTYSVSTTVGEYMNWNMNYQGPSDLETDIKKLFDESITGVKDATVLLVLNKNRCITSLFTPAKVEPTETEDGIPLSKYITDSGYIDKSIFYKENNNEEDNNGVDNIVESNGLVLGYFS